MKKTKIFASALCLGAVALSLASCGDNSPKIQFYCSAGNSIAPVIQKRIDAFNKNSDVKIVMTNPGNYDPLKEKVKKDLKVNNQPAIAYCYPDHVAEYLDGTYAKKVINIGDRFDGAKSFLEESILPAYLEEGKVYDEAGTLYSIPFQRSTECIYVNLNHLNAAGVKTSDLATWEGLFAALPKIRAAVKDLPNVENKKGEYKQVLGYDSEDNLFITLCHQYNIPYTASAATAEGKYLFANEGKEKVTKMLEDLNKEYKAGNFTTQEILGGYTSNEFVKGNISISIGSTGGANHQNPKEKFSYAVLPLPKPAKLAEDTNLKGQSVSQGPSLVMFEQKDDKYEDVAWKFVKEVLLSDDIQVEFSTTSGYLPVTNSALNSDSFKGFITGDSIMAKTINVASGVKENLFQSPAFNGSNTARNQVGILLAEATKSTDKNLTAKIQELIAEAYDVCSYFE